MEAEEEPHVLLSSAASELSGLNFAADSATKIQHQSHTETHVKPSFCNHGNNPDSTYFRSIRIGSLIKIPESSCGGAVSTQSSLINVISK